MAISEYTIKNLFDIADSAAGRHGAVESRFARSQLDSEHLGVSHIRYGPGFRAATGHHHREQEEVYVVLAGSGRVKLDDAVHEVRQWDVVRVSPSVVRAFEAGSDGLDLLAIGSDRPEGGDGTRVEDFWTD